jgi:hypothetical protein
LTKNRDGKIVGGKKSKQISRPSTGIKWKQCYKRKDKSKERKAEKKIRQRR